MHENDTQRHAHIDIRHHIPCIGYKKQIQATSIHILIKDILKTETNHIILFEHLKITILSEQKVTIKYISVDGDIVVEISGGSPTQSTGRAAVVSDSLLARYDKGMVCTNFCKAIKPIVGFSMYVFHYWQYLYNLGVFFSYENGTTGIKNLDINGFLETEPINIAPVKLIEKFNTFCQSVNAKVYSNGLENERLAEIRDMILPKLMSGAIDVSEIEV